MRIKDIAYQLVNWLKVATVNEEWVMERYMMNLGTWGEPSHGIVFRPDCNFESAYAFLKVYQETGDVNYRTLARAIFTKMSTLQYPDGSWPFYTRADGHINSWIWTNDNSEDIIYLTKMSEIDVGNASTYLSAAQATVDFLLSIQKSDGSWRVYSENNTSTPIFSAHAAAALAYFYRYANNKPAIESALHLALAYLTANISGNTVLTSYEITGVEEAWRPPSSDHCIVLRAFLYTLQYVGYDSSYSITKNNLLSYLFELQDSSGAIQNGKGTGRTSADVAHITDHVYTSSFALECLIIDYTLTPSTATAEAMKKLVTFLGNNIYYSHLREAHGMLRGAYNLRDHNWDTSEVIQNGGEEGGGNAIYSGWTNAPIAAQLFEAAALIGNIELQGEQLQLETDAFYKTIVQGREYILPLVPVSSEYASKVSVNVNGRIKALAEMR